MILSDGMHVLVLNDKYPCMCVSYKKNNQALIYVIIEEIH